jgi:uncharacterized protein YecE (DUF72 family)
MRPLSVSELIVGCCGWNYGDSIKKGGWVGSVYPKQVKTNRLGYYSKIFSAVEFDAIFYEKFYSKMGHNTFHGMIKATPKNFEFSVKVPETITHMKRLDPTKGATDAFELFLETISPLRVANKLGAILIQLPPSFSVKEFRNVEHFLDKLPKGYDYAVEFRHPSWQTEGPWELLRQYNVAAVMTDSPDPQLQFLSDITLTANNAFVRLHGRKAGFWYDYLYSKQELEPWVAKVNEIKKDPEVKRLRIMFNNHYRGSAAENALEFKELLGDKLTAQQTEAKNRIRESLAALKEQQTLT